MPFSILRDVKIDVELPRAEAKAIRELGYGANAKVLVGFRSRPWEKLGYSGATYSDQMFQLAWANSLLAAGHRRRPDAVLGRQARARRRAGIGRSRGGAAHARHRARVSGHDGRAQRQGLAGSTGRRFPWTKGSYSCYKPGQWTTIAGAEGLPVGNLFFAGEHCSYDFQGYMNGAAQSGADTARGGDVGSVERGEGRAAAASRRALVGMWA